MQRLWSMTFAQRTAVGAVVGPPDSAVTGDSFHGELLIVPVEQSALQISDVLEAESGEDRGSRRAANPCPADDDDRTLLVRLELARARGKILERNQYAARNVTELAVELLGLAHVEHERRRGRLQLRPHLLRASLAHLVDVGAGWAGQAIVLERRLVRL